MHKYRCAYCAYESDHRWLGRCPIDLGGCGAIRNCHKTGFSDEAIAARRRTLGSLAEAPAVDERPRVRTGIASFDELTSGGPPVGTLSIISGEGGAGKTTLEMMLADGVVREQKGSTALFVSSEQDLPRLYEIAQRCGLSSPHVKIAGIVHDIHEIVAMVRNIKPAFLVVDSIHETTMHGVRASSNAEVLMDVTRMLRTLCQKEQIAGMGVAHMTRAGEIRAPATLDHYVDAMLEFDVRMKNKNGEVDEATRGYRKLTLAVKSRIGPGGSCYFNMTREGVITPLDEDTYFGRKKKRKHEDGEEVSPDDKPRPSNLIRLADKYRKSED